MPTPSRSPLSRYAAAAAAITVLVAGPVMVFADGDVIDPFAAAEAYTVDDAGNFVRTSAPQPTTDAAFLDRATAAVDQTPVSAVSATAPIVQAGSDAAAPGHFSRPDDLETGGTPEVGGHFSRPDDSLETGGAPEVGADLNHPGAAPEPDGTGTDGHYTRPDDAPETFTRPENPLIGRETTTGPLFGPAPATVPTAEFSAAVTTVPGEATVDPVDEAADLASQSAAPAAYIPAPQPATAGAPQPYTAEGTAPAATTTAATPAVTSPAAAPADATTSAAAAAPTDAAVVLTQAAPVADGQLPHTGPGHVVAAAGIIAALAAAAAAKLRSA